MKWSIGILVGLSAMVLAAPGVQAHCDSIDGPVATAALKALEARNVNLVLPYVAADAETELANTFDRVLVVRGQGSAAKELADRLFMETAVRLHRAGEHAPYTGLKPAGTDFGPAIPAAETAMATGDPAAVLTLITHEVTHGIAERFTHVTTAIAATKEPMDRAQVPAARERVRAEFAFIEYVETLFRATRGGGGHPE
jgi:hypothetical protein